MAKQTDIIIVGAGHNGLVASIFLARAGLDVTVLEQSETIGGAARTEYPFKKAPNLGASTGAYLLGLMPPELIQKLGVKIDLVRRDPHYFIPTTNHRYLLFGSNQEETKQQFLDHFSKADWLAHQALQKEINSIREDISATWLMEPLSIERTAERYVRSELQSIFINLCRGTIADYLNRFDFKSDLVKAMYAVTDAFSGLYAGWDTPGSGMNFLIHNMCRLPKSDGTWMIAKGGMGAVTQTLAKEAVRCGVQIRTSSAVDTITCQGNQIQNLQLKSGEILRSKIVVANCDPFTMRKLVGQASFSESFNEQLNAYRKPGSTLKVNLCLKGLPEFSCLKENRGQHGSTIHLLPNEEDVIQHTQQAYKDVTQGHLPKFPTIEWYIHTTLDGSLRDAEGRHNGALFVQWVPYEIKGSNWEKEEENYVRHLLKICDTFAPGTSGLVEETFTLTPPKIESYFGMTQGHIHHIDNSFGFSDRLDYRLPIEGLYSCSAGCHPAGSVIGASGYNAAHVILQDLNMSV